MTLPPLDPELIFILGRPNFACGMLAHAYRDDGAEIAPKAEAEQAFVIHKMLGFYLEDPATWREKMEADIAALRDRQAKKQGLAPMEGA